MIREIYKTNKRPPKDLNELNIPEALHTLRSHHNISLVADSDDLSTAEVIINDLEEVNPFRLLLVRSIHGILEFDRMMAVVFSNHILFLGKDSNQLRVHFKPEEEEEMESKSFFHRLFHRRR
ncbi:MAG: hypothetical protein K2I48_03830 [Muribaculaceae bacterium]|nr:hypothetical protein [Muribaculaceae bacterium]